MLGQEARPELTFVRRTGSEKVDEPVSLCNVFILAMASHPSSPFQCILNNHDWIVPSVTLTRTASELGRKAAILRVALCRQEKARDVQFPPAVTPPGPCHTIPAGASTSTISTLPLHARRALTCCSPHPGLAGLRTPRTANTW
ncbi:hypothetical protein PTTG_28042 [Puccinia triticina 1-1 BBBD Race 1]|uniref:Uncharacterized protein n=1 Tax=Puccinia triticina (isolate 1-1 / race 1 (BBBD)) TaxID=630390 RepID=A0A180GF08_PUCT1|nr:hypothetical protein PTTG_28042 [Puccinia triticina 1-1 BBBD Race 1]WAR62666.1 hypothetical protein PtB15_15B253 [Puccinia triticina]